MFFFIYLWLQLYDSVAPLVLILYKRFRKENLPKLGTLEWDTFNPDCLIRISTVETFNLSPYSNLFSCTANFSMGGRPPVFQGGGRLPNFTWGCPTQELPVELIFNH